MYICKIDKGLIKINTKFISNGQIHTHSQRRQFHIRTEQNNEITPSNWTIEIYNKITKEIKDLNYLQYGRKMKQMIMQQRIWGKNQNWRQRNQRQRVQIQTAPSIPIAREEVSDCPSGGVDRRRVNIPAQQASMFHMWIVLHFFLKCKYYIMYQH